MKLTPILLVAHSRPNALRRRLEVIEKLPTRCVQIAIDGPRKFDDGSKIQDVLNLAEKWATKSHHNVELNVQVSNLGILNHLPVALENSIQNHEKLIVIEDDIEFSNQFIDFVEENIDKPYDIFALQGFNPSYSKTFPEQLNNGLVFTKIPTVWGWAARSQTIEFYLNFMNSKKQLDSLDQVIHHFALSTSHDYFLRNGIRSTWLRKMERLLTGQGGSWDNWWVLACWASQKNLLMPEISLSREEADQSEGQTHKHSNKISSYISLDSVVCDYKSSPKFLNREEEIRHLKVWGISRMYSWVFALRVIRNIHSMVKMTPKR